MGFTNNYEYYGINEPSLGFWPRGGLRDSDSLQCIPSYNHDYCFNIELRVEPAQSTAPGTTARCADGHDVQCAYPCSYAYIHFLVAPLHIKPYD